MAISLGDGTAITTLGMASVKLGDGTDIHAPGEPAWAANAEVYDYWIVDDAASSTNLPSARGLLPDLPVDTVDSDGFYLTATQTITTGLDSDMKGVFTVCKAVGLSPGNQIPGIASLSFSGGWLIDVRTNWVQPPTYTYSMRSMSTRAGVSASLDRALESGETGAWASGVDGTDARTIIIPDDSETEVFTGTGFNGSGTPTSLKVGSLRENGSTNLRYKVVGVLTGRPTTTLMDELAVEYGVGGAAPFDIVTDTDPQDIMAFMPLDYVADSSPGVLYFHGASNDETQIGESVSYSGVYETCAGLAEAGYPVLSFYCNGDHWGNEAGWTRVDQAITYLRSTLGATSDPVAIIGASMGGCALSWIADGSNLSDVACFAGMVPVSDIQDVLDETNLDSSINAAYGGSYDDETDGPAHNPTQLAANGDLDGLVYKAWYGASDAVCRPITITTLAAALSPAGSTVEVTGHHNSAIANLDPQEVIDFIVANLA